jgi:hypothetical protein
LLESFDGFDFLQILVAWIFPSILFVTNVTEESAAEVWFLFGDKAQVYVLDFLFSGRCRMNFTNHFFERILFFEWNFDFFLVLHEVDLL